MSPDQRSSLNGLQKGDHRTLAAGAEVFVWGEERYRPNRELTRDADQIDELPRAAALLTPGGVVDALASLRRLVLRDEASKRSSACGVPHAVLHAESPGGFSVGARVDPEHERLVTVGAQLRLLCRLELPAEVDSHSWPLAEIDESADSGVARRPIACRQLDELLASRDRRCIVFEPRHWQQELGCGNIAEALDLLFDRTVLWQLSVPVPNLRCVPRKQRVANLVADAESLPSHWATPIEANSHASVLIWDQLGIFTVLWWPNEHPNAAEACQSLEIDRWLHAIERPTELVEQAPRKMTNRKFGIVGPGICHDCAKVCRPPVARRTEVGEECRHWVVLFSAR